MIAHKDILVTGGNGKLGKALGALGCTALGREQMDITSTQSLQAAIDKHKPALIINCAAYTAVDRAEAEPDIAYAINRDGVNTLAQVCAGPRLPLIHISTDCVFGNGDLSRPMTEDDVPAPLSVYGKSKLAGEEALRSGGRNRVCIARVSWLFDEGADTFVSKILKAAEKRDRLEIVDDAYGRPTHVHELAKQLITLARRMLDGMPVPEILHLGTQAPICRYEWAKEIFIQSAALGGPIPVIAPCASENYPQSAHRPRRLILDIATANALLGHMPDWRVSNAAAVACLLASPQPA